MVQGRAARFVLNKPHRLTDPASDSVTDMLKLLEWESLERRRKLQRVTFLYKVVNCLVAVPLSVLPPSQHLPSRVVGSRTLSVHNFLPIGARVDAYKYSLLPQAVLLWNQLPTPVQLAPELQVFKDQVQARHRVDFCVGGSSEIHSFKISWLLLVFLHIMACFKAEDLLYWIHGYPWVPLREYPGPEKLDSFQLYHVPAHKA